MSVLSIVIILGVLSSWVGVYMWTLKLAGQEDEKLHQQRRSKEEEEVEHEKERRENSRECEEETCECGGKN